MASKRAKKLKEEFYTMSDEDFEPLTFKELSNGESFITLPMPGDNSGHGGLRGAHYLFIKINNKKAYNKADKKESGFTEEMLVIKIQ